MAHRSDSLECLNSIPLCGLDSGSCIINANVNKKVNSKTWISSQGQEERQEEQDTVMPSELAFI